MAGWLEHTGKSLECTQKMRGMSARENTAMSQLNSSSQLVNGLDTYLGKLELILKSPCLWTGAKISIQYLIKVTTSQL